MGTVTRTYDFTNGTTADADQVDTDFNTIYNEFNGNIENANIKADAAIDESKLAFNTSTGHDHDGSDSKTIPSLTSGVIDKTRHINFLASGAVVPATNGAAQTQTDGTNKSYYTLDFDKDTDESAFWSFVVPDQYDGGNVIFNIWCKTSVTSGNVVFVIKTGDIADTATFDAALGTTITFDAKTVDGTAGDLFVASKTADPGWTAGRLATIKLYRDVSEDDAAADISVLLIEAEWEVT